MVAWQCLVEEIVGLNKMGLRRVGWHVKMPLERFALKAAPLKLHYSDLHLKRCWLE